MMKTASNLNANCTKAPLLVLLPGAHMSALDLQTRGFLAAATQLCAPINVISVETGLNYYQENDIVAGIHEEVVLPARSRGSTRIWLAGISIGGMGALLYAQAHPKMADGLILLSPFLSARRLITEIDQVGGLQKWQPDDFTMAIPEHRMLAWLSRYQPGSPVWPELFLAYGLQDRFRTGHQLLASLLPLAKVVTAEGGHDWETWTRLWSAVLSITPLGNPTSQQSLA